MSDIVAGLDVLALLWAIAKWGLFAGGGFVILCLVVWWLMWRSEVGGRR